LRPDVPLQIGRSRFTDNDDRPLSNSETDSTPPIELIEQFCTNPLPKIWHENRGDGFIRSFAEPEGLGQSAALTCILRTVMHEVPLDDHFGHLTEVSTPARNLIHDCIVDPTIINTAHPELIVAPNQSDVILKPAGKHTISLPIQENTVHLGSGFSHTHVPFYPDYQAILENVTKKLNWEADNFVVHRTRIAYPVLHSVAWTRFSLASQSTSDQLQACVPEIKRWLHQPAARNATFSHAHPPRRTP
ncbi:MAG: hypothetical protein AAGB34_02120, partial [Planctomycetota bacterium]